MWICRHSPGGADEIVVGFSHPPLARDIHSNRMVDSSNVKTVDHALSLAPDGWQPIFNVD